MFLRNVGTYLIVNTAQNLRILLSLDRRANELHIIISLEYSAPKRDVEIYSETLKRFYKKTNPLQ